VFDSSLIILITSDTLPILFSLTVKITSPIASPDFSPLESLSISVIIRPVLLSIGIGFAIPINTVQLIVSELKKHGTIERDFITGLHVQKIDRNMQRILEIDNKTGLIITDIDKDSSGEKSGLAIGDVILTVNENSIGSVSDVIKIINEESNTKGDFINLGILRKGKILNIKLELMGNKKAEVFY
jgi:serine protease Do